MEYKTKRDLGKQMEVVSVFGNGENLGYISSHREARNVLVSAQNRTINLQKARCAAKADIAFKAKEVLEKRKI
jgi:hypothetical protein